MKKQQQATQVQFKTAKYFPRDCRGRFIKKSKNTFEDQADCTERMFIEKPTWMYVQQDCKETDFKKYWSLSRLPLKSDL